MPLVSQKYAQSYFLPEPSVLDWFTSLRLPQLKSYFPCITWLPCYNRTWFLGDLVAGITVAVVVIPQGITYSGLGQLSPQYGLYSSFVSVMLYWIFGTSKDITIGPVAVASTLVGQIVLTFQQDHPQFSSITVASALAILAGAVLFLLGLTRLGFLIEFIPLPAIAAFLTGSAINIISGQCRNLLGEERVDTRDATYLTIFRSFKALPTAGLDAAMGVSALILLYIIRFACTHFSKSYPQKSNLFFFISTLRTAFVIIFYTMISWLVNMHRRNHPLFGIVGKVPRGLQSVHVPQLNTSIIRLLAPHCPGVVITLVIEHIAIAKSLGRIDNYTINPSQELMTIGFSNLLGPFFGAFPVTGSFSRSAIQSKAGSRTPLSGVITGLIVLLAIYVLPPVFFYVPKASLSAVIIHAVGDLITPPKTILKFWKTSPPEFFIFWAGVLVSLFQSIQIGVYVSVATTVVLLLCRIAKANGEVLGRVSIRSSIPSSTLSPSSPSSSFHQHDVWLPVDHQDGSNSALVVPDQPYPGVFVFRMTYSYLYANAFYYTEQLVDHVMLHTRRSDEYLTKIANERLGDRPWNDPGPARRRGRHEKGRNHPKEPQQKKQKQNEKENEKEKATVPNNRGKCNDEQSNTVLLLPPETFWASSSSFLSSPSSSLNVSSITLITSPTLGEKEKEKKDKREEDVNEDGLHNDTLQDQHHLPTLKAIVLDFSSVIHMDVTSAQNLYDVRIQLDKYAAPDIVEWHFANVRNAWVRRALVAVGFGGHQADYYTVNEHQVEQRSRDVAFAANANQHPIFSSTQNQQDGLVEEISSSHYQSHLHLPQANQQQVSQNDPTGSTTSSTVSVPVLAFDNSAFHIDVSSAVDFIQQRQ